MRGVGDKNRPESDDTPPTRFSVLDLSECCIQLEHMLPEHFMQTDSDSIDNTDRQKTSAARETFDAVSFYGYDFIFYNNIFPFKIWSIIYF